MHNERCTSGSEGGHRKPAAAMPHGADARPYPSSRVPLSGAILVGFAEHVRLLRDSTTPTSVSAQCGPHIVRPANAIQYPAIGGTKDST